MRTRSIIVDPPPLEKSGAGQSKLESLSRLVTNPVVLRRRMRRDRVLTFAAGLPACVVALEACCGAHHMGRALAGMGHEVRLMLPEHVQSYVKARKNDDRDEEAIAEAATRPTMRFVTLKSGDQLDVQTLHRVRDRPVGDRTSLTDRIRGLLLERGQVVAQGRARLRARLADLPDGAEAAYGLFYWLTCVPGGTTRPADRGLGRHTARCRAFSRTP